MIGPLHHIQGTQAGVHSSASSSHICDLWFTQQGRAGGASKPGALQAGQGSQVQEVQGALIMGAGPVKSPGPSAEAYGSPEARTFFANAEEGLAAMDRVRLVP